MVSYAEHWDFWINGGSDDIVNYAMEFVIPGQKLENQAA